MFPVTKMQNKINFLIYSAKICFQVELLAQGLAYTGDQLGDLAVEFLDWETPVGFHQEGIQGNLFEEFKGGPVLLRQPDPLQMTHGGTDPQVFQEQLFEMLIFADPWGQGGDWIVFGEFMHACFVDNINKDNLTWPKQEQKTGLFIKRPVLLYKCWDLLDKRRC